MIFSSTFLFFLIFFWLIREVKSILFWLFLWQLKEYHLGRFIDHFRTEKGKKLLLNKLLILKVISLFSFISIISWRLILFYGVFFIYFLEVIKVFFDFFKKKLIKPIFTKKIVFLTFVNLAFLFFYLSIFSQREILIFRLLLFDILTPAIVSGIILVFQPFTALIRYRIIKRAKEKREKFKNLLVIGITGSYGKTSTKEFLHTILTEKFGENKVLKTKEHQNSEVGISQCILNDLKPEHEIFICEMGAYNKGGIKLLCDIVKPRIGIITGVNEQHLATFGSMENLLSAEGGRELIDSLPEDGIAFFNGKNKYCWELFEKTELKKRFLYGENAAFPGQENILGAIKVAKELGMTDEEISRGAEKIKEELPGVKIKKGKNGLIIFDATYSANPDGVISHLEYLTLRYPQGKKIIVMPCLIELGSASKEVHRKIGEKIGKICDLAIIVTKERFKDLKEGFIKGGGREDSILFLENPKEIFEKIKRFNGENDIVLLEGRIPKELVELLTK